MKTNLFLFILLLLEITLASCCEKQRNEQVIDYINATADGYSDSSILKAMDSAAIKFKLSNDELRLLKKKYQIQ